MKLLFRRLPYIISSAPHCYSPSAALSCSPSTNFAKLRRLEYFHEINNIPKRIPNDKCDIFHCKLFKNSYRHIDLCYCLLANRHWLSFR
jgi:hypothetical protein